MLGSIETLNLFREKERSGTKDRHFDSPIWSSGDSRKGLEYTSDKESRTSGTLVNIDGGHLIGPESGDRRGWGFQSPVSLLRVDASKDNFLRSGFCSGLGGQLVLFD